MGQISTYLVVMWSTMATLVTASTFNCYSCTYVLSGDRTVNFNCVTAPENVTQGQHTIPCQTSCIIKRQWDGAANGGRGWIRSFYRGCGPEDRPPGCQDETSSDRVNCYTTCTEDLCNSGSGVDPQDPTNREDPLTDRALGRSDNIDDNNNTNDGTNNNNNNDNNNNNNNRRVRFRNRTRSAGSSVTSGVLSVLSVLLIFVRSMMQ